MADKSGKTWMAVGETDDPTAVINSFTADGAITKGAPVYLTDAGNAKQGNGSYIAIGIAINTVADGEPCGVLQRGRVKVTVDGDTPAGSGVRSAGNTKVTPVSDQAVDEGGAAKYTLYGNRQFGTALMKGDADGDLIFINVER
jgi:hypothetical protein